MRRLTEDLSGQTPAKRGVERDPFQESDPSDLNSIGSVPVTMTFSQRPMHRRSSVLCKQALAWVAWLACVLGLVACSGSGEHHGDVRRLHIALSVEVSSLDPQTTASVDAIKVQSALFETLVRVDSDSGEIQPGAATAWEISADQKTYRFQLDRRLNWSDGTPLQASDFVFALRRLLDPRLAAPFADLYLGIAGSRRIRDGEDPSGHALGVRAPAPDVLEIELERAIPYFLSLLARPCAAALPEAYLKENGAVLSRTAGWTQRPGFPVSGPYELAHWGVNEQIALRANEDHPEHGRLKYDMLHFYPIESAYAQEHGFQTGALDVTSKLASERISAYRGSPVLRSDVEMGTFYVVTQTRSTALQDASLRRALSASVNRQNLVQRLRQREELPAVGFVPPLWQAYSGIVPSDLEPAAAAVPLADAEPVRLRLLISSSEGNLLLAEALQAMWKEALPVEVEIVRQEWKSYLDSRTRGDFDLCLATWIGDYFDPLTFLELWHSQATNNFAQWGYSEYDRLLEAAAQAPNAQHRLDLLAQAERLLIREAPILPLFHLSRVYLQSERVEHWPQTLLNTVNYLELR